MKATVELERSRTAPPNKDIAALNAEILPPLTGLSDVQGGSELAIPVAPRAKNVGYTGVSADIIERRLREQGRANAEEIASILWLHGHGREQRVPNLEDLARLIGYGEAVLSQVLGGKYAGSISSVAQAISSYRRDFTGRAAFGEDPILDALSPTKAIAEFCATTRHSRTMGILWAPSHVGKSRGLMRYAATNNHGRTPYVEMPPGGAPSMFMHALMRACGISERNNYSQMLDRAVGFFSPDKLLIVDQMHRTILGRKLQTGTLDLLIHLYDKTGCGIVLCGTPVFIDTVRDERLARFFEQIANRGVLRLQLPTELPYHDARSLGMAYGLPAPDAEESRLVRRLVKEYRLGKLVKLFSMARRFASVAKESFAWEHVEGMIETLRAWALGEGVYGTEGGQE